MNTTIADKNVFDSWSDYQIKLLFNSWNIVTPTHMVLSCIFVFSLCIVYHLFKIVNQYIKTNIHNLYYIPVSTEERTHLIYETKQPLRATSTSIGCWRFGYFMVSLCRFTMILFLGLMATTFNPWVCLSLVLGNAVGDLLVISRLTIMKLERKYN